MIKSDRHFFGGEPQPAVHSAVEIATLVNGWTDWTEHQKPPSDHPKDTSQLVDFRNMAGKHRSMIGVSWRFPLNPILGHFWIPLRIPLEALRKVLSTWKKHLKKKAALEPRESPFLGSLRLETFQCPRPWGVAPTFEWVWHLRRYWCPLFCCGDGEIGSRLRGYGLMMLDVSVFFFFFWSQV